MDPQRTLIQVLAPSEWVGAAALASALVATPIFRWIAYRTKVVDRPDDLLKPHGRPIAYLGGVAIWLGFVVGLAGYVVSMPGLGRHAGELRASFAYGAWGLLLRNPLWNVLGIAVSSGVIMVVGLMDDLWDLKPRSKVLGQVAAAGILLLGGVGDRMSMVLFAWLHPQMPPAVVVLSSMAMCLVLVVMTCNAMNLIDGLDGLCGGVSGIISLGFLALAAWLATYSRLPGPDELRVGLCLAMAGAVLGFLPYNIPPASIFMGDAGSMLLGFFVAAMMALFCQEGNARWFLAAWAVFALPVLDTSLAVVRRLLSGTSLFAGDRSHLYDQLVDRGWGVKRVVALFYLLAAVAAVIGVMLAVLVRLRYALLTYAILLAAVGFAFHRLGMIRPPPRQARSGGPPAAR